MLQKPAQKRRRSWPGVTRGAVGEPRPRLREPGREAESQTEPGPHTWPGGLWGCAGPGCRRVLTSTAWSLSSPLPFTSPYPNRPRSPFYALNLLSLKSDHVPHLRGHPPGQATSCSHLNCGGLSAPPSPADSLFFHTQPERPC